MGRAVNIIYGLVLIVLAVYGLFVSSSVSQYQPVLVTIMGALILFTPLGPKRTPYNRGPTLAQNTIRFVFGLALVAMGILTLFPFGYNNFPNFQTTTFVGQLIIAAIGAIYILSGTALGNKPIAPTY